MRNRISNLIPPAFYVLYEDEGGLLAPFISYSAEKDDLDEVRETHVQGLLGVLEDISV